jgi:hydroxyethylthiazole kinase-like uncharacterized protein yjeF
VKARRITAALLRSWPLPVPDGDGDKVTRGRLLMVAGSAELPGAAILAADAALRSGVGKLCVATDRAIASVVALAVPEARVIALERRHVDAVTHAEADASDALLIGPGMDTPSAAVLAQLRKASTRVSPLVVDAGALEIFAKGSASARRASSQCVATPHLGEMAHLTGYDKDFVEAHAADIAREFAASHKTVVVLKGATTFVADPDGNLWTHDKSNVGLAISGSGDVLAGIVAALVARGAPCVQAAVWGVALHARAGAMLVARHGRLGGLARELPHFIPAALRACERG